MAIYRNPLFALGRRDVHDVRVFSIRTLRRRMRATPALLTLRVVDVAFADVSIAYVGGGQFFVGALAAGAWV